MAKTIEQAFQEATAKKYASVKNCKECIYFSLIDGRESYCSFDSNQLEHCIIIANKLHLVP